MTMKLITGEDLLKYLKHRMKYLSLKSYEEVIKHPKKDREKIRRMFIGRLRELKNLIDLDLSRNKLSNLPDCIGELKKLTYLNIGFNSDFKELPESGVLLVHLGLVAVLGFVLPISKLLHIPGVFYSPTRNQVDNPREKRHIVEWAKELDEKRGTYPEFKKD